jgi:hypothetical protein
LATSVSIREKRVTLIDNFLSSSWHLFTYSIKIFILSSRATNDVVPLVCTGDVPYVCLSAPVEVAQFGREKVSQSE